MTAPGEGPATAEDGEAERRLSQARSSSSSSVAATAARARRGSVAMDYGARALTVTSVASFVPRRVRAAAAALGACAPAVFRVRRRISCARARARARRPHARLARLAGSDALQPGVRALLQVWQLHTGDTHPPTPPCSAPLRALLLFADVSGYSRLTRWMAGHFEDGPWATSQILNKARSGTSAHGPQSLIMGARAARPTLRAAPRAAVAAAPPAACQPAAGARSRWGALGGAARCIRRRS
jgi:hypothetical protein